MIKTVNASPLIPALIGAAVSLMLSVVTVLLSAFFLTESKSLELLTAVLPKIFQVISALVGGFFAGKLSRERGYLSAIISGLLFSAVIAVGALINSGFEIYYVLVSTLTLTTASLIGSLLAKDRGRSGAAKRKSIMKKMRA